MDVPHPKPNGSFPRFQRPLLVSLNGNSGSLRVHRAAALNGGTSICNSPSQLDGRLRCTAAAGSKRINAGDRPKRPSAGVGQTPWGVESSGFHL